MKRIALLLCVLAMIAAACSSDTTDTTTAPASSESTTTEPAPTTTAEASTTTEAATTTAAPTTTTTTTAPAAGAEVATTPIIGQLQPYNEGGAELFAPGSVEAHWYQWDGLYVVLYRGFDAASGDPICAGNSIYDGANFVNISDSPHAGEIEDICDGVPKIAEAPSGAYSCGSLLYYLTEIPVETAGTLFGTLEIVSGGTADGQTSQAPTDLASTPEFEPGLSAYELPASNVDDLTLVACG